jgi:hypothetical protein
MPWEAVPSPGMEPDPPSMLHRIRWGNVAWALAALVAIGLVLAWPHLQRRGPGLPDETASVPSAPVPQPVAPATPLPSARPTVRPTAPRRHPAPARHRRRAHRSHARRARGPRRRARRTPATPPPPLDDRASPPPEDANPMPPAGDQEFLPG